MKKSNRVTENSQYNKEFMGQQKSREYVHYIVRHKF